MLKSVTTLVPLEFRRGLKLDVERCPCNQRFVKGFLGMTVDAQHADVHDRVITLSSVYVMRLQKPSKARFAQIDVTLFASVVDGSFSALRDERPIARINIQVIVGIQPMLRTEISREVGAS